MGYLMMAYLKKKSVYQYSSPEPSVQVQKEHYRRKLYSLEYKEIPEVFFTSHHGRFGKQVASLIKAQRNCGGVITPTRKE
jgi:hypothetical protein